MCDKKNEKEIRVALADNRCKEAVIRQKFNQEIDAVRVREMELLAQRERICDL